MAAPYNAFASDVGLDAAQPVEGLNAFAPDPNAPGPFKRGLGAGVAGVKSSLYGAGALAAHGAAAVLPASVAPVATGLEQAALGNVAAQNEIAAQGAITYQDVLADPTRLGEFLKYTAGTAGPSLATMAAGGGVGAGIGALVGRKAAATLAARALGITSPAVKAGALAGAVAPDFAMEAGSIYPEALKTGVENPALRSVAGGAGASAIDFLTIPTAFRALLPAVGAATRKAGAAALAESAVAGGVAAATKAGGAELAQEVSQTFIERLAAGQDVAGPDAVSDYITAGITGLVGGGMVAGPVGAFHGARTPGARPAPIPSAASTTPEAAPVTEPAAPPTPEQVHADLTARHAAATEQLTTLEPAVAQIQTEKAALIARQKELAAEMKKAPGDRRIKKEITDEKSKVATQLKAATANEETMGGQLFAARAAVEDLSSQIGSLASEMQGTSASAAQTQVPATPLPEQGAPSEVTQPSQQPVAGAASPESVPNLATSEAGLAAPEIAPISISTANNATMVSGPQVAAAAPLLREAKIKFAERTLDNGEPVLQIAESDIPAATSAVAALMPAPAPTVEQQTTRAVEGARIAAGAVPNETQPSGVSAPLATNIHDYVVEELAKKKGTPEKKIKLAASIDSAIADITAAVATIAPELRPGTIAAMVKTKIGGKVSADVQSEIANHITSVVSGTQQSKGASEVTPAGTPPVAAGVVRQMREGKLTQANAIQHLLQIASDKNTSGEDRVAIEGIARRIPLESNAALTQDEFESMPPAAQEAATTAYNTVMRQKGMALRTRLAQLLGDRPELKVMTFSAEQGGPIGSYTRTGPLKAAISMALNAKEGLSVADHEGYHFAEDWLLSTSERRIVDNAMKPGKPLFEQLKSKLQQYDRENQTNLTDEVTSKSAEARAYGFEFWRRGELKAEGALSRVWQKLQQFFERVSNAVKGLGFQSIEDVFTALDRGQMAEREMVDPGERAAYESRAGGQTWYRSALTDAVAGIASKQASAQGWKDQIKGLIAKGAAKQVELDAVGLNDWLDLQQGKVTKDQVMAFLGKNGVQMQEVTLGGTRLSAEDEARYLELNGMNNRGEIAGKANRALAAEYHALRTQRDAGKTKFASYQLPGGENYRELLLTLPTVSLTQEERLRYIKLSGARTAAEEAEFRTLQTRNQNVLAGTADFRSSHYDQPNILAHVRFNGRTDADGKRVLFLEEIQSDWAQKGRKEGFRENYKASDIERLPDTAPEAQRPDLFWYFKTKDNVLQVPKKLYPTEAEAIAHIETKPVNGTGNASPPAPFVGKTEAWTALALKRMIRYAAENGFDKVAWTTGEQQAARYDLSKHLDRVDYEPAGAGPRGGLYEVTAYDKTGKSVFSEDEIGLDRIEEVLGKEIAKKIEQDEGKKDGQSPYRDWRSLSGLDLKVGGEGMKGYYDKIVPSVANDILKKLGGGKVVDTKFNNYIDELEQQKERLRSVAPNTLEHNSAEFEVRGLTEAVSNNVSTQPGFTITPALAERAANGVPLFSKAAVEMSNRMADGELEAMQVNEQYAHLIENAKAPSDIWTRGLGIVKEDLAGGLGRWWTNNVSTPNYISAASAAFKNVYQAFNTYIRYGKILNEQLVREKLPGWYKASDADRKAAFDVMLKRTVEKYSTSSQELAALLAPLTPEQRTLYNQATDMVAGVLQHQFDSQKETRKRQLTTPGEYEKWLVHRQEQMDSLLDTGYVPLRRYGDYSVAVYMETPDGKRVKAGLEFFSSPSAAQAASVAYAREIERSGAPLKVELGRRSKNERDTGVSLEQFLGTLRRQGIDISQAERERLVVAMTNTDSIVRTQMMRREGLAGFSTDSMRVLHEFGVNTTNEIAYARFAPVLDAALDGAEVTADVNSVTSAPIITIGESFGQREDGVKNNLWEREGPMSGFHKDRANALADAVLVPNRQGAWATKLRTMGVMYFIGGSISGAAVNALSIPMLLVPHLSMHTDYIGATTTAMKSWKDSWQHYNILRDMDRMKNPDAETAAKLDAAGITKEMRAAIVAAADHIFDTEIHMMLGISQGTLYSKSRNLQRAAEAWMAPFRVAEQTNRLASFMAAYKVGQAKNLSGQELFRFASEVVDATQNNYNPSNRPGIMNNPVGALMFQFKSFPLFIIEAIALMHKQSPKSAVYMLLGLTAMAGVQGLPFAEEILNLIDVISQQLFGSPFNSRRAMRNAIKTASDAIGAADLSDAVMRGMINEMTGVGIATRVSSGLLPGTRLGAADADQGRILSEIAGAPYSMVKDTMSNVGGFVSGVATGDWLKAADAIRAGGPIALRNIVKGAEQLSSGYASDTKGRKVVDVSTLDGLFQLTGLSSAQVTNMQDHNSIVIQVKAFHTQVSQDMQAQLVRAYRDGDTEKQNEIMDFARKWNAQYPNMPIMPSAAAVRRAIMLADVPLDRRAQMLLGRRMQGEFSDVLDEE